MRIWRNKFLHIPLVGKETASLVGNLTAPLSTAPQLHQRLAHMGISSQHCLQQLGKQEVVHKSVLWNTIQPSHRVVPPAGKNWEGIPSE